MMQNILKRAVLPAVIAAALGLVAIAAVRGTGRVMSFLPSRSTSTSGKVTSFLLAPDGRVDGLLLDGGDQLRLGPETGEAVAAAVKVGDDVTATGNAGTKTDYGRELRVESLSANGQTFTHVGPTGPPDGGPRGHHGPRGPRDEANAPAPPEHPTGDAITATGSVAAHLVNHDGGVDGLVLSGGEQVRFGPEIGALVVKAESGGASVTVEGTGVRTERGTIVRPSTIKVGDQTFTMGR